MTHNNQIVIDYPVHNTDFWGTVEGVLLYLRDMKINACVSRSNLKFMYTPNATCGDKAVTVFLNYPNECRPNCLFETENIAVQNPPLSVADEHVFYAACKLPSTNATINDENCSVHSKNIGFVTFGPYARLGKGQYNIKLEYSSEKEAGTQAGYWDMATEQGRRILMREKLDGTNGVKTTADKTISLEEINGEYEVRTFNEDNKLMTIFGINVARQ